MDSVEARLKMLAGDLGANLTGITSATALADGPPSADPHYLLPSAKSVISFAVSLDRDLAKEFISKKNWLPHCENRKRVVQTLYQIGDALAEQLKSQGYEALSVDINNNYRAEKGAADVSQMTEFHPDFSHRYAAVAAGIGRLGWSGNLLTAKYGALVELGSVLTSAVLTPDNPMRDEEHPCDRCKMCSLVCPVEMVHPTAAVRVTVAGVTETIARKQPNTCCWIGCTGYEGLSSSGTWSNWSPYRLGRPLPKDKQALDMLCIRLQQADPQMQAADNSFSNYRRSAFDPGWFYYTVCGFCRSVCFSARNERLANHKLIMNSGTAALKLDGSHVVAGDDPVCADTPFGLKVVVPRGELSERQAGPLNRVARSLMDQEVIAHLCQNLKPAAVE